jgi:radical SAM/Cys-rich protein
MMKTMTEATACVEFGDVVGKITGDGLHAAGIETFQVNVGFLCNQRCVHCHVEASPGRTETMQWSTMEQVASAVDEADCRFVDVTGGAPELHPHFRPFIVMLRDLGIDVQIRTNLTVLLEPAAESMPEFFRDEGLRVVASMPCYLEKNVRAQRGSGVYERSIEALKRLNSVGYGVDPQLPIDLVYNPGGAFLPPEQPGLETDYRRELAERFDIVFSHLLTITNMPIGRFHTRLRRHNKDQDYMRLLRDSFNPETVDGLMCRRQISVGWDGSLYDCDFNLVLGRPLGNGVPTHIAEFDAAAAAAREIVTGEHCFGCTAGSGSSCRGALVES